MKLTLKDQDAIIAELQDEDNFYNVAEIIKKLEIDKVNGIKQISIMKLLETAWSAQ